MSGIFDDGNDVGPLFGHVDQITTGSMGEFHSVNKTVRADDIGNVGYCSARGGAEIKHLVREERGNEG